MASANFEPARLAVSAASESAVTGLASWQEVLLMVGLQTVLQLQYVTPDAIIVKRQNLLSQGMNCIAYSVMALGVQLIST